MGMGLLQLLHNEYSFCDRTCHKRVMCESRAHEGRGTKRAVVGERPMEGRSRDTYLNIKTVSIWRYKETVAFDDRRSPISLLETGKGGNESGEEGRGEWVGGW